jgi:hypothetical protein
MRKFFLAAAAALGIAVTGSTASAQHNVNRIHSSGNGAFNTVVARNHSAPIPLFAPPGFGGMNRNTIVNSGNGVGNTIVARNGGTGFNGFNGSFPGGGVFPGGVNVNVVANSGNGVGNTILAGNNAPGGLNINVVANSGNGVGNQIILGNRR